MPSRAGPALQYEGNNPNLASISLRRLCCKSNSIYTIWAFVWQIKQTHQLILDAEVDHVRTMKEDGGVRRGAHSMHSTPAELVVALDR